MALTNENGGTQRNAYNQQEIHKLQKTCMLEYGLKYSPCSTEWADVRYKCIRD